MKKPIPTHIHGILDYLSVIALFSLPRALHWPDRVTALLTGFAVLTLIYSLLTRYELGAIRLIPMRAHLIIDLLSGLTLCAVPFVLYREPRDITYALIGMGVFEIVVPLLTQTHSRVETHTPHITMQPQP